MYLIGKYSRQPKNEYHSGMSHGSKNLIQFVASLLFELMIIPGVELLLF